MPGSVSMLIRDALETDAPAIAKLHAESWRSAYRGVLSEEYLRNDVHRERLAVWQSRFSQDVQRSMFAIVAEMTSGLAGFVCVFPQKDATFGSFLDNLHVAPQLTGQGIGRKLLSESARRLANLPSPAGLYLWVIEQNYRARRFYEKAGAQIVGSALITMPDERSVAAFRCYWS